jgi:biotin carboxyl carrier protein
MIYDVTIGGHRRAVELRKSNGGWTATVDGEVFACDIRRLDGRTLSLIFLDLPKTAEPDRASGGGRAYTVYLDRGRRPVPGTIQATLDGLTVTARVSDRRHLPHERGELEIEGRIPVHSPMAGRVIRIAATLQAEVAEGDPLLVLEAMKMQNELRSPKNGRVVAIHCREGAAVGPGELLIEIE